MPNRPLCKRRAEEDNQDYLQKKYCPTRPSSFQEDGQSGRSGSFGKKKSKVYPLCKRPAEDQFSNQLHGICIQPVGDPLHSHRLISRVELAHQGEGQFQSSGLRSNPTLFIDRNRQSPAHNHPFQQNKKDTQNTKVPKYKSTVLLGICALG